MLCLFKCFVGLGLLGASIATMIVSKDDSPFREYKKSLDKDQRERLEKITDERLNIYLQGLVVGLIIALVYLYSVKSNSWTHVCVFLAIMLGVNYLWYILSPKSDWMLKSLNSKEQKEGWLKVYRTMQYRWHMGFLLGGLGGLLLSWGLVDMK